MTSKHKLLNHLSSIPCKLVSKIALIVPLLLSHCSSYNFGSRAHFAKILFILGRIIRFLAKNITWFDREIFLRQPKLTKYMYPHPFVQEICFVDLLDSLTAEKMLCMYNVYNWMEVYTTAVQLVPAGYNTSVDKILDKSQTWATFITLWGWDWYYYRCFRWMNFIIGLL